MSNKYSHGIVPAFTALMLAGCVSSDPPAVAPDLNAWSAPVYPNGGGYYGSVIPRTVAPPPNVGSYYAPIAPPPFTPPRRNDDDQPPQAAPTPIQPVPKVRAAETVAAPAISPVMRSLSDFGTPTFVTPLTPPADATDCTGWWRICHAF